MPPQGPLYSSGNYVKVVPAPVDPVTSVSTDDETILHTNISTKKCRQYPVERVKESKNDVEIDNWGFPNYLTESQAQAVVSK